MVHLHRFLTEHSDGRVMIVRLPRLPETPSTARRFVLEFLTLHASHKTVGEFLLVATELVTNAVKYGDGDWMWLYVTSSDDGAVSITVTNHGQLWTATGPIMMRVPPQGELENPDEGGRGLPIVATLCDKLDVFSGTTTVVRATKRFASEELPAHPLGNA